ncbi:hypothetical protein APHAL10511_005551 [Amanita phalloides]|nr:hypothetical protein APHAL10511_005551 [Amanita phalloides]
MPYYGPLEDGYVIKEKANLAGNFVCGVGYGMQLVLYIKCARYLWAQRKIRKKISLFLLGYTTVLQGLSLVFLSSSARMTEDIFIHYRNYPGGPLVHTLAKQILLEKVLTTVAGFLLTCLSDLLVLWRCWVVWNSSGKLAAFVVTTIPGTALLASFALGIQWTWRAFDFEIELATAYLVTSLSSNILLTILIVLRLVLHRRRMLLTLPPEYAAQYVSLATIIIESAALYSVFALAFTITYAIYPPISPVFLPLALTFQQIAGYLIILRVARGRARNSNTLSRSAASEPHLSPLNFNAPVFNSHIDMDQELIDIEPGNPPPNSILLVGSVSSSMNDVSAELKTTLNHSKLQLLKFNTAEVMRA